MAGLVKLLTGARLIIEIVTCPDLVYVTERARPTLHDRVMKFYSDICLHLSLFLSDRVHLLYPTQLCSFSALRKMPRSVFHEFVPVSIIDRDEERELREQYVLLVGAPWYLKGADILIEAFLRLAGDFPDIKLKLLGYYPDRTELQALTRGSGQIEILQARPHPEALKIIKGATVVVLPSRCEGLGRVLIEAMAAAVPVIGSDVGGIPMLIRDGENGFLVPVGDHQMLSIRLRQLLDDEQLRRKMGESGYVRAHRELNEETYAREFAGMIRAAVSRKKT